MLQRIGDRNILVVYAATLLLGTGYGLAISLTSLLGYAACVTAFPHLGG